MPQAYCRPCRAKTEVENVREFEVARTHLRKTTGETRTTSVPWLTGTCAKCGQRVSTPLPRSLAANSTN